MAQMSLSALTLWATSLGVRCLNPLCGFQDFAFRTNPATMTMIYRRSNLSGSGSGFHGCASKEQIGCIPTGPTV